MSARSRLIPSGLHRILTRMRVSTDVLRIPLLVAMGVTAGYFWRAAFEARPLAHLVTPPGKIAGELPATPPVRIIAPSTPRRSVRPRHVGRVSPVTVTPQPQLLAVRTGAPTVRLSHPKKPTRPTPGPAPPPPPRPGGGAPPPSTPPSPSPATEPARAPVAAAAPPQPPPAIRPEPQPNPSGSTEGERPGRGHGDENHDHSGSGEDHQD
jgi:hypothetical protein